MSETTDRLDVCPTAASDPSGAEMRSPNPDDEQRRRFDGDAPCSCGHVRDEHRPGHECEVDECLCCLFEYDEEGDADGG